MPFVLLVEDNAPDVYIISRVLKQCGVPLNLQVASDGEQALTILREAETGSGHGQPSLILLDWNLPGVSGAEVLAYTRQSGHLRDVPVIVVTSTNAPRDVAEMTRLRATAHFRKPTDLDAYLDLKTIVLATLRKPPRTVS